MISNKSLEKLAASVGTNVLVRIEQNVTDEKFFGFVVGVGTEWLLMHCFNGFVSEGYRAFHMDCIVRATTKGEERWTKMLAAEGVVPLPFPEDLLERGDLDGAEALLTSVVAGWNPSNNRKPESSIKILTTDGVELSGYISGVYPMVWIETFTDSGRGESATVELDDVAIVAIRDPMTITLAKYLDLP